MKSVSILVVEDDLAYQTLINEILDEYDVIVASCLLEARDIIESQTYNFRAMIIDISLPDGNGLRFLNELVDKGISTNTPCIILSGHKEITNKVSAFSLGAEDFVEKPFDPIEFKARLSAKISKYNKMLSKKDVTKVQDLLIDFNRQKVFLKRATGKNEDLQLTSRELSLLIMLTASLGHVYTREQILNKIWSEVAVSDRTVDSHIAHLRKKLTSSMINIKSMKGVGYYAEIKS